MKKYFSSFILATAVCLLTTAALKAQDNKTLKQITSAMEKATMDWNKGDLNGYMALYAPEATMMMPNGRVGLDSIRALYVKYYFNGGAPKQQLSYDSYQLTMLGKDYALLTGRFILKANDKLPERIGRFSVILVHKDHAWKLLHDHSG